MSSVLTPYLLSLEQLRQALGSRDEALIAAVLNSARQERARQERNDEPEHREEHVDPALMQRALEHLRQAFGDELLITADRNELVIGPGPNSGLQVHNDEPGQRDKDVERALRQLVMGEHLEEDAGSQYGYALELLCRHFGEVILPDAWGGVRWMAVEDAGLADILTRTGPPVSMPDTEGFTIGHLTAAEVAAKVSELGNAHLTSDNDELQELLDEYEGWLRTAASKQKAIVFFYN
jgi:hypothetical protein